MNIIEQKIENLKRQIAGGLIVSCQAPTGSPLHKPEIIAAFAETAEQNGAVAVRIDSPEHIAAVKSRVKIPVLGIYKIIEPSSDVYITPTFDAAKKIADAGADLIAVDATLRRRPADEVLADIVEKIKARFDLPVMADVATFEEGLNAGEIGCNFIGTTLSGYTKETQNGCKLPDFNLVEKLSKNIALPVICEGRLRSPEDVKKAFEYGAFAAVVGTAITGVDILVREFLSVCPSRNEAIAK